MKAYLIDPEARTVTAIELDADARGSTLPALYRAIDCELVEVIAGFPIEGHDGWIDEEGFLYDEPKHGLVFLPDTHQRLFAGRVVVTGFDDEGNTTAATCSAQDIARRVFAVTKLLPGGLTVCAPLTVATADKASA